MSLGWNYEKQVCNQGFINIAGVDEAGRGPLAGPVVAAAVVFAAEYFKKDLTFALKDINDSKKLSEKKRERLFESITNAEHVHWGIGKASCDEIDELNILNATHNAMKRALLSLVPLADYALIDGNPVHGLPCPSQSIIKGDSYSYSIAAASILAKVTRDRILLDLHNKYPDYGFDKHKGYGTKAHLEALQKFGVTPFHRHSFRPVKKFIQR